MWRNAPRGTTPWRAKDHSPLPTGIGSKGMNFVWNQYRFAKMLDSYCVVRCTDITGEETSPGSASTELRPKRKPREEEMVDLCPKMYLHLLLQWRTSCSSPPKQWQQCKVRGSPQGTRKCHQSGAVAGTWQFLKTEIPLYALYGLQVPNTCSLCPYRTIPFLRSTGDLNNCARGNFFLLLPCLRKSGVSHHLCPPKSVRGSRDWKLWINEVKNIQRIYYILPSI